jgi:hypothetical protein
MKNKLIKFFKWFTISLVISVLVIAFVFLKPLDKSPYYENKYFYKTTESINNNPTFDRKNNNDTIRGSWAKVSLIPPFKTPIAIDANRKGKPFDGIHDSLYVRTFVFSQGKYKVAYVIADLLIIPPSVTNILDTLLKKEGYSLQNIYLSATHTHTGIGAWHNSFIGELFAGKYDQRAPDFIAQQIKESILLAEKNQEPLKFGYKTIPTKKLVYNRLLENGGEVDSLIRVMKIEKQSGEKACLVSFTAHATCLHNEVMELSGDWPGMMMQKIDSTKKVDFCAFSAGSVASHGPYKSKTDKWQQLNYTTNLACKYLYNNLDSIPLNYSYNLNMVHQPILMREPNYRIFATLVLRQRWFYKFFGKEKIYINMLRIGDVVFAGMPCDFSGEMSDELDDASSARNKNLFVTSFNGCFIGYITDDRRYDMNTYETRTMNWYGPGNGSYLTEIIMRMMNRI